MDNFLCILAQNLKWVAALTVVKKILFYLIFCLLRSLVSHMQNDKIQIRKSLNLGHPSGHLCRCQSTAKTTTDWNANCYR